MVLIRREKWQGKYLVVVREKGKVLSRRRWSPNKFNLDIAKKKFKNDGTFRSNTKVRREKLKNVQEIVTTKPIKFDEGEVPVLKGVPRESIKDRRVFQYVVEGDVNGIPIAARSRALKDFSSESRKQAREEAMESFLERLDNLFTTGYDAKDGLEFISRVSNLRGGFVSYRSI